MSRLSVVIPLILLLFASPAAHAGVGYQRLEISEPEGEPMEVGIWYPTDAPTAATRVQLFDLQLAQDAPVRGRGLPLVVISHGTGGSFAGHVDTAVALAEAGFVVAALTHPGDNWRDQSRATEVWRRPRHLKRLVDYMIHGWRDRAAIAPDRIGAFGFSAGGFTVLAAAGGEPDLAALGPHCRDHPEFFDCRLPGRRSEPAPASVWVHDPRLKAVVAAAPALGFTFSPAGLARVRQPVQLWRAEADQILPHPHYAEAVRKALPHPPETHLVVGAGHFDFLAPCPAELARRVAQICLSAPGFDRAAFHVRFNRDVVAFFSDALAR